MRKNDSAAENTPTTVVHGDGCQVHLSGTVRRVERMARRSLRQREFGAFLRERRGRLTPAAVGLVEGPPRRTPGLRREEVANLAGLSVGYYTRLEQGHARSALRQRPRRPDPHPPPHPRRGPPPQSPRQHPTPTRQPHLDGHRNNVGDRWAGGEPGGGEPSVGDRWGGGELCGGEPRTVGDRWVGGESGGGEPSVVADRWAGGEPGGGEPSTSGERSVVGERRAGGELCGGRESSVRR
ncbi:helix-turn-helix domain-containing protein [Kribbella swartbergensis]